MPPPHRDDRPADPPATPTGSRRNRVDPWGDLHAVADRGMFTGNRGCLVDADGGLARHHRGNLWITCVTDYGGRRFPLAAPGRWTPLFFLDDAVALAAGHRPCGFCRREAYLSYRNAVARTSHDNCVVSAGSSSQHQLSHERPSPLRIGAGELNRRLATERLRRGRGLSRSADRRRWNAPLDTLPTGTVVIGPGGVAQLVVADALVAFAFSGWGPPQPRTTGRVEVLTPPTSVAALANGYLPILHPSAHGERAH